MEGVSIASVSFGINSGINLFELFCTFDGFPRHFFLISGLIPPHALGLFFQERYEDVHGTHGKRISVVEFQWEGKMDLNDLKVFGRHPWRTESESKKFDWSPNIIFLAQTDDDAVNQTFSPPSLTFQRSLQQEELLLFYGTLWQKKMREFSVSFFLLLFFFILIYSNQRNKRQKRLKAQIPALCAAHLFEGLGGHLSLPRIEFRPPDFNQLEVLFGHRELWEKQEGKLTEQYLLQRVAVSYSLTTAKFIVDIHYIVTNRHGVIQ